MSSSQPLYIEASDEITTVVERLQEHEETSVLLVAPKGAAILQSIVNLKLIKKAAKDAGKHVILVTTDKIGLNLAIQIGLDHAANVDEAEKSIPEEELQEEAHVISGVKIHRYYEDSNEENQEDQASPIEPIVPKKLMKEQKEETAESLQENTPIVPVEDKEESHAQSEEAAGEADPVPSDTQTAIVEQISPHHPETPSEAEITRRTIEKKDPETLDKAAPRQPKKKARAAWLVGGLIISLLLISGGTAFLYLPKTDVTAHVPATPWKEQYTVAANLNPGSGQVTAQNLSMEDTQSLTFKATGTKELGEKAHGTATAYNGYSSDAIKLPAGTQITAKGKNFTTDADVNIPGARVEAGKLVAGSINVAITASEAGPDSNIDNTQATSATANVIIQIVSTTGGSSRIVTIVNESDITTAKNTLTQNLKNSTASKLAEAMKGQDFLSDSTTDVITVDALKATVKAGDEKDSGEVSGSVKAKRMVIKTADIQAEIEKQALAKASSNMVVKVNNVKVIQQEINTATSTASISCDAYGTRSVHIDTTNLPKQLAGKSFKEGTDIIHNLVKDKSATISYSPPWWPRSAFPSQPRFIRVHIIYE